MHTLTINGQMVLGMTNKTALVGYLDQYSVGGIIRSHSWGEVTTQQFVDRATAGIIGSGGRSQIVYNAPLCPIGGDQGVVKFD